MSLQALHKGKRKKIKKVDMTKGINDHKNMSLYKTIIWCKEDKVRKPII
mgnify:CR=1 FL=1